MNQAALLNRYRREAVSTASPAKLLTMLYDRLVLDLDRAAVALEADDRAGAHAQLTHAQDIVHALRDNLDVAAWDGGPGLLSLYDYLLTELVGANVARDAARVTACRDLVIPLREAWHEAAATAPGSTPAADGAGLAVG